MSSSITSACSSLFDLSGQIFENIPEDTREKITIVSFLQFSAYTIFTFNPQAALMNASLTSVAMLTQAVVISLLQTAGIEQMYYPFMLVCRVAIPIFFTGFLASKCSVIPKEEVYNSIEFSLATNLLFELDNDIDSVTRLYNCRTDNISVLLFTITA